MLKICSSGWVGNSRFWRLSKKTYLICCRHLDSHPLFRKLTDEEQNQDPVVEKLWESTEEGQKVLLMNMMMWSVSLIDAVVGIEEHQHWCQSWWWCQTLCRVSENWRPFLRKLSLPLCGCVIYWSLILIYWWLFVVAESKWVTTISGTRGRGSLGLGLGSARLVAMGGLTLSEFILTQQLAGMGWSGSITWTSAGSVSMSTPRILASKSWTSRIYVNA